MTTPVQFYLDTNIVLDIIDNRRGNANSVHLLEQVRSLGEVSSTISIFVIMEAIEQRQESLYMGWLVNSGHSYSEILSGRGRSRSLTEAECGRCYDETTAFRKGLGRKLRVVSPASDAVWKNATELVRSTNIGASDALHVAIAHSAGCQVFATNDRALIRELSQLHFRPRLIPLDCHRERKPLEFQRELTATIRRVRRLKSSVSIPQADATALKESGRKIKDFFTGVSAARSATKGKE